MNSIVNAAVCAVPNGADLGRHAGLLARVHDALLSGQAPPADPRDLVARSWARVQATGVDPEHGASADVRSADLVEARRHESGLRGLLPLLRASLTSVADEARHVMVVTDAEGVLLWREGSPKIRHRADTLGFMEGADWSEAAVGTNGIGTALIEDAPVQIFSAEHFVRSHHRWTCTACPVHDPRTGEMLGVVDVSGPADTVHPTTVALVYTAVKLAESSLWREHEGRIDALRGVAAPVLAGLAGPGLVVDDHGWVAAVRGMAPVERVAAPQRDRPQVVHGLGTCVPEPLPGGWLLRAVDPVGRAPLELRFELDSRPPRAVVTGASTWYHPLSRRRAEVLLLLAVAGARGMDAPALSEALYGHRGHLVTVRAEMSRLRRTLGGLLLARPYRIADGVRVVLPEFEGSAFLSASGAPGVRRLRLR